jgi:IMP dehydrogenase
MATFHPDLPRGARVKTKTVGTMKEILLGPAPVNDGTMNLFGALRESMATCGYQNIREFQRVEVSVAPSFLTEGKSYQRQQGVGMG